jgi:DNA-binding response OmpR family regulator
VEVETVRHAVIGGKRSMAKYRILIVDDEEDIRTVVRHILSRKYEVVEARDGLDALERLPRAEPDFIIMDVMMPLMDGFRACEAIRKDSVFQNVPVLFLSALNTRDNIKQGYSSGGNLYLTKPFDPQRLLRNVDLFFETTPPPMRPKSLTIEQLAEEEKNQASSGRFEAPVQTPPPGKVQAVAPPIAPSGPPRRGADIPTPVAEETQDQEVQEQRRAAAAFPRHARSSPEAPDVHHRPRLMVVDDDEDIVATIETALARYFEVTHAYDGIEAIEKIVSYEPDLIAIDALMPRMTGYQLCQSLRRNRRFHVTPILFMSGKSSPKDVAYAQRIGGNDFLPKPFEIVDLRDRLMALTKLPSFELHPKRLPITDIFQKEELYRKERAQRERERHVAAAGGARQPKEEGELEKFLRELGNK